MILTKKSERGIDKDCSRNSPRTPLIVDNDHTIWTFTMLRLKDMNIIALPIHDALIVPSSSQDQVREVMLSTFKEHTGIEGLVTVEKGE